MSSVKRDRIRPVIGIGWQRRDISPGVEIELPPPAAVGNVRARRLSSPFLHMLAGGPGNTHPIYGDCHMTNSPLEADGRNMGHTDRFDDPPVDMRLARMTIGSNL